MSSFRQTEYVEDAAAVANPQGPMTMARRKDTLASEVTTDGDNIALNATSKGELYVKQTDAVPVTDNGGSLTVDGTVAVSGTVAVTQSGTWDEVGINDSGNSITVDAPVGTPAFVRLSDGSAAITTLPVSLASVPSHAVTNAGTFATQVDGAALTALQLIDDPVQVLGTDTYTEASSKGVTIGAVRRDADTTLVDTTNEFGPLQMDANGRLKVEAFSGETLPVSLSSTTITGTVAATQSGTWNVGTVTAVTAITNALPAGTNNIGDVDVLTLPALPAGTNNIGDVDVLTLPALPAGTNNIGDVDVLSVVPGTAATNLGKAVDSAAGATDTGVALLAVRDDTTATLTPVDGDYVPLRTNSRGGLWVDLETRLSSTQDSIAATQSGTWTEANSAAIAASLSVMDDWDNAASDGASVSGDTAHDAADAGEPVKVGGKAYNMDGTAPGTAVAEGDRANFITDLEGRQCVTDFHPNHFSLFEDHTSAQTNNQLKAAPGASLSIYITDIVISNGATAGSLKLVEDEGGTPAQICGTMYFAINGGAALHFRTPKKLTANKSLGFTSVSCTTHSIEIHGFIGP